MPETGPQVGISKEEERGALTPKERALKGFKETLGRLKEKGISLPSFRKRLEAQARGEEEKDPDVRKAVSEIKSLAKAERREERELTDVEAAKVTIETLSRDPSLSPKILEEARQRLAEFEAKDMMGKISLDPERRAEQFGRIFTGVEGEKLAKAMAEVAAREIPPEKTPYPKPKPLPIGGGEKGFFGKGRGLPMRLVVGIAMVPAVVAATCILGGVYTRKMGEAVSPEGYEEAIKPKREAIQTKGAEALIVGRYLYRDLEKTEQQGERGKDLARLQLDKARDLIVEGAKIDGVWKKYELDQVKDPQVIARLIHDYPNDFDPNLIEDLIKDPAKRKLVKQFLEELKEKEVEETGYKPSLRETAVARAEQRSISAQAQASKKILGRRERGLT